jgi:transcriptional regulator with XRE-family HTH domain
MAEATTLGTWLRRERERRGVTLIEISEQTKLSVPLLQGLEADDLSRWPGGIFRRAFARSYATAIGVDPDLVVRRVEEEHPSGEAAFAVPTQPGPADGRATALATRTATAGRQEPPPTRAVAAVLDLFVAGAIGLGFAAGGSRLLWPVLAIAAYHAIGVVLIGRSPMLALLLDQTQPSVPSGSSSAVDEDLTPVARADRAQTGAGRLSSARLRQSGRRRQREARARA